MSRIIVVLHLLMFFLFREEVLSLWTVLPYLAGVCVGKFVDDTIDDMHIFVRSWRSRKGT